MVEDNTVEKFVDLPPHVKEFLCKLEKHDMLLLEKGMQIVRNLTIIGGFLKWLIGGGIAVFVAAVTCGDAIVRLIGFFRGSK